MTIKAIRLILKGNMIKKWRLLMEDRKLELIADFYEFTMANGYFEKNMNYTAYFDVFFRKYCNT